MTDTVIYPFAVVMNKAKWDALPDDVKKVFDDLRVEQSEWTGTYMDDQVKTAMDWSVKEQGVEVITLSAEDKAKWDGMLDSVTTKWIADAKEKGLPAEQIVADIKALIAKYSK
jgi:TRAP-type C4-dicarboxylate transport system substrate-binding protein